MNAARLLERIEHDGLLPMHDSRVVSATALLAGEPISGSWWSHPKARAIYATLSEVEDHEDVASVKLLGKKVTLVHRRLWGALFAVATEKAEWQMRGLGAKEEGTLERIETSRQIRADQIGKEKKQAGLLGDRLLVFVSSVHTDEGRHEKVFESWASWRKRVKLSGRKPAITAAKHELETAALAFAPLDVPWPRGSTRT